MPWLINSAQLDKFRKNQKNLIILDASFHHDERNAGQEFLMEHIIDAYFFNIDMFSDPHPDACHSHFLIQDKNRISTLISNLGIRNDYKIIFYDNSELHSACRALWMFKMFGHDPNLLYILDGGFKAWKRVGGKLESGQPSITPKTYTANLETRFLRTLSQLKINLTTPLEQIVDARHPVRYSGGIEPRSGVRRGHIPGSFCLPSITLFGKDGCFLPLDKIRKKFIDLGVDLNVPIVTSCGSGITAPILNFALDLMNHPHHALYNGSWSEWGAEKLFPGELSLLERPIETCID
ncbi:MAG: sseA [Gammaproteobacteria bacterium]|jgi:thiosulfate/3-mercaptopyruvate sulfurtransferase|nr:sseA [Gammaproteobacteria bacterium]